MKLFKVLVCLFLVLLSGAVIYINPPSLGAIVAAWLLGVMSFFGLVVYMDNLK